MQKEARASAELKLAYEKAPRQCGERPTGEIDRFLDRDLIAVLTERYAKIVNTKYDRHFVATRC